MGRTFSVCPPFSSASLPASSEPSKIDQKSRNALANCPLELTPTITAVRIDVWLWAARFFKTRALAKKACELGRVLCNGQPVKPARTVHVGERLRVSTEGGDYEIDVAQLSDIRGPAPVAQNLYRETESGREQRLKAAEERKANRAYAPAPVSRPSKRDRRRIIQFRDKRDTDRSAD